MMRESGILAARHSRLDPDSDKQRRHSGLDPDSVKQRRHSGLDPESRSASYRRKPVSSNASRRNTFRVTPLDSGLCTSCGRLRRNDGAMQDAGEQHRHSGLDPDSVKQRRHSGLDPESSSASYRRTPVSSNASRRTTSQRTPLDSGLCTSCGRLRRNDGAISDAGEQHRHSGLDPESSSASYRRTHRVSSLTRHNHQQHSPQQTAHRIGRQIIQARGTARQIDLMPLIQSGHHQRPGNGQRKHSPAAQTAGQPNRRCQHGKQARMSNFVPRSGEQTHGNRLCAAYKQTKHNAQRQQQGKSAPALN